MERKLIVRDRLCQLQDRRGIRPAPPGEASVRRAVSGGSDANAVYGLDAAVDYQPNPRPTAGSTSKSDGLLVDKLHEWVLRAGSPQAS